ncbi:DsbA family protein [Tomitella cavernea]|uniref:Thioredoxin-like fold domain-containing protein n=1 Tax=Tomitella cavernea TaxID=1387982 RepID=A0ABP9CW46_9ACTN|nr:thioredoxin domain-containing protein [Tomitella cavernea]
MRGQTMDAGGTIDAGRRYRSPRSGRRRAVAVVAGAALVAGVLAGCGSGADDSDPGAPAPDSSVPDTTASASPAAGGASPDLKRMGIASVVGVPVAVDADGAIRLGIANAPVILDVYEDYYCEACGQFTDLYGDSVYSAITGRRLAVRYHSITILDGKSPSGDYSTRAAAAARCVALSGDAVAYSKFRDVLFTKGVQPREGGKSDISDAQLAHMAQRLGADEPAVSCIADGAQVDAEKAAASAARSSLAALSGGSTITPSVYQGAGEVKISRSEWLADVLNAHATPAPSTVAPTTGGR